MRRCGNDSNFFIEKTEDYFTNCGLLRLDIRSDYEITSEIVKIVWS